MKNHFDISDSIEICEVDIVGVACMVKTLKNLLLWNQMADDLETWYAALGAQVLPSMLK